MFWKMFLNLIKTAMMFLKKNSNALEEPNRISITTLPETNSEFTPENGWLEDEIFPFGVSAYFSGALAVSFTECNHQQNSFHLLNKTNHGHTGIEEHTERRVQRLWLGANNTTVAVPLNGGVAPFGVMNRTIVCRGNQTIQTYGHFEEIYLFVLERLS